MSLADELSRIARRKLLSQITTTDRLVRMQYIRAANDIAKEIRTAKRGSLTERWLVSYKRELDKEIERLGRNIYGAITDGAQAAAEARAEATAEYLRRAAAQARIDDSFVSTLSQIPTDAVRAVVEGRLYTDGRRLSARIWSATGRLEGNISQILQQGVAQQMDALTLARHLEAYVNPEAACPVSWHKIYPDIPFDRKIDYNALRLARTTLTHAHWLAGREAARKNPLCRGMKWHLSDQHYERQIAVAGEDVCDECARHDEGLGRGVWSIDRLPLPHPQCLCYQTEELPSLEEVADFLGAWARGERADAAMESGFQKWQKENAAELNNWYSLEEAVQKALDKSGEFGTMDTGRIARAMLAEPVVPDERIYQFMLRPGSKHNRDFVEVGYLSEADGERLRADILAECAGNTVYENVRWDAEYQLVRYEQYIQLGSEGHRFLVAWKIARDADTPQLVTCYRKEGRK